MRSLFIIPYITSSRSFARALMSSWVKHYLVHWWANLNTACHVSRRPYAGEGRQGERVNHSSWGESAQEAAVALMFVCEGEDPTDPRWRMVWSRLWLMLQDSSALLVLPHSESLETAARSLSSCVPLSCMLTISCFLEEEKRNQRVKDISIKREWSSLKYVMLNAPRQQMKNILLLLLETHSLQFNLSSAFKLYAHWNALLSSAVTFPGITADIVQFRAHTVYYLLAVFNSVQHCILNTNHI